MRKEEAYKWREAESLLVKFFFFFFTVFSFFPPFLSDFQRTEVNDQWPSDNCYGVKTLLSRDWSLLGGRWNVFNKFSCLQEKKQKNKTRLDCWTKSFLKSPFQEGGDSPSPDGNLNHHASSPHTGFILVYCCLCCGVITPPDTRGQGSLLFFFSAVAL